MVCWYDNWLFSCLVVFFFFKQKTAYEMRISDWSSDVCSSDLDEHVCRRRVVLGRLVVDARGRALEAHQRIRQPVRIPADVRAAGIGGVFAGDRKSVV